ncbi:MAG: sigma-54-dependent Fis family transcriptional regulator [Polyangiaceae bacterium]|nr:sigma-54-dependent Fis family transcriptional regulator [Polyangiaceae bacterium]
MAREGEEAVSRTRGRILVADDEPDVLNVVTRKLERSGFEVSGFESSPLLLEALRGVSGDVDVVLADLHMPDIDGLELLRAVHEEWPTIAFIVMTGRGTIGSAVEAMRLRAFDYLVKPFDPLETVVAAVDRAVNHKRLVDRNQFLERQLELTAQFEGIVGSSKPLADVFAMVESVAPTDVTVLVTGESGTGKELVARAIHTRSHRASRPFIAINCAALAESVLESELFGHVRGAFTGAVVSRRGLFEEASGGTLFLDEVGELAPATQVRLLRVLQEGEIRPLGANDSRRVDVRIIAATHRDLANEVQQGAFRQDLFYRLNVVSLKLPPLRERRQDLPALVHHFIKKAAVRFDRAVTKIDPEALERILACAWPGNVRELENAIERAVVLARGDTITPELLPADLRPAIASAPASHVGGSVRPLGEARANFERHYLEQVIRRAEGNTAEAARLAGVDRSNFRRLLKRYGLVAANAKP